MCDLPLALIFEEILPIMDKPKEKEEQTEQGERQ